MELPSSASSTYAAVTDHGRAPEIFSNIVSSTATPIVRFFTVHGPVLALLNAELDPTAAAHRQDVWRMLRKFMRAFQGSWNIQEMPGGGCKVEHTLQVTPLISPPPAFAGYTSRIFIKQVTGIMEDLQQALKQ